MNNIFFGEYVTDDLKTLDNLTKEYDLCELRCFFEGNHSNENIGFGLSTSTLTFDNVNNEYPIEIIRSHGYSIYKVSQGGYFYVFWTKPLSSNISSMNVEPSVYFSAYLFSNRSEALFDSITPQISTAEDVKQIDPYFELSFLISSGIFSYSYLNDDIILQIEYEWQENINEYHDLIVKEKKVVSRSSAMSRFSTIFPSDLVGLKNTGDESLATNET